MALTLFLNYCDAYFSCQSYLTDFKAAITAINNYLASVNINCHFSFDLYSTYQYHYFWHADNLPWSQIESIIDGADSKLDTICMAFYQPKTLVICSQS